METENKEPLITHLQKVIHWSVRALSILMVFVIDISNLIIHVFL